MLKGHGHHIGWAFTSGRLARRAAARMAVAGSNKANRSKDNADIYDAQMSDSGAIADICFVGRKVADVPGCDIRAVPVHR